MSVSGATSKFPEPKKVEKPISKPASQEGLEQEAQAGKTQKAAKRGMNEQFSMMSQMEKPSNHLEQQPLKTSFAKPSKKAREDQRRTARASLTTPVDLFGAVSRESLPALSCTDQLISDIAKGRLGMSLPASSTPSENKAYAKAFVQGLGDAAENVVKMVLHPIDTFAPVARLARDMMYLSDGPLPFKEAAIERMKEREVVLHAMSDAFDQATGPDKLRAATGAVASFVLPGAILRGGVAGGSLVVEALKDAAYMSRPMGFIPNRVLSIGESAIPLASEPPLLLSYKVSKPAAAAKPNSLTSYRVGESTTSAPKAGGNLTIYTHSALKQTPTIEELASLPNPIHVIKGTPSLGSTKMRPGMEIDAATLLHTGNGPQGLRGVKGVTNLTFLQYEGHLLARCTEMRTAMTSFGVREQHIHHTLEYIQRLSNVLGAPKTYVEFVSKEYGMKQALRNLVGLENLYNPFSESTETLINMASYGSSSKITPIARYPAPFTAITIDNRMRYLNGKPQWDLEKVLHPVFVHRPGAEAMFNFNTTYQNGVFQSSLSRHHWPKYDCDFFQDPYLAFYEAAFPGKRPMYYLEEIIDSLAGSCVELARTVYMFNPTGFLEIPGLGVAEDLLGNYLVRHPIGNLMIPVHRWERTGDVLRIPLNR